MCIIRRSAGQKQQQHRLVLFYNPFRGSLSYLIPTTTSNNRPKTGIVPHKKDFLRAAPTTKSERRAPTKSSCLNQD